MKALLEPELRKVIDWEPHKVQQEILNCESDEIVIAAGRGTGKTFLVAYMILKSLLKGEEILLVAPTYELCNRVLEYVDKWLRNSFPPLAPAVSMRPPQSIDFRKIKDPSIPLSVLEARSAESPEGMLGKRFDLVIIDEAARIGKKIWEQYIFPTTQVKGGRQVYISTPLGRNTFYELWLRAKETGGAFQFESKESPYFTEKDWNKAKERLPEDVFDQEYKAMFLSDAAAVFKRIEEIVGAEPVDAIKGHRYIMGLDLGRKRDFTVMSIIDTENNHVVHFDRFNKQDWAFQKKKIEACARRYNHARIIIDSNNVGDAMVEELERAGLLVDPCPLPGGRSQKKKELIEKLAVFIENKYITIPDNEQLIDELHSFGYEFTPAGRIKYKTPSGIHDDCVMSLAYAVSGLRGKANPKTVIQRELEKNKVKVDNYKKFI